MTLITSPPFPGYELLDSGGARKLERIAGRLVDRPSPQALWRPRLPAAEWKRAQSVCVRTNDGGGFWQHPEGEPRDLGLDWQPPVGPRLRFLLRFTSFGHCGVFFEQEPIWRWLCATAARRSRDLGRPAKFLNLFGYTGAASLAMAAGGAEVFHVDSAKGVLAWGKENAAASALPAAPRAAPGEPPVAAAGVRWVHEDAGAFLRHSRKKGFRYDGILADPPTWGHGPNKEVWELEPQLQALVDDCAAVLADDGLLLLTSHTPGVQHQALRNVLAAAGPFAALSAGDLGVAHAADERLLPAGVYACGRRSAALPDLGEGA